MDNRTNYQINVEGDAFIAVQNLFAEFTKIVQVVEQVDTSVQDSTRQITEHVDKTSSSFGKLQDKIRNISLTSMIEQVEKVSTAISNITAPGIGFEQSMADLSSITGIAGDDLIYLGKIARQTGKDSGLGAQQAADAFAILASQIQVDKIGMEGLLNLQKNTITLSQAAGMSMNDAALALAGTINQFGLQASEATRVINVLAAGSKYGAAEIVDLSQSFKVVGAAAAVAGLSVEGTAGAIEVLSKNNLKGAEAGTALRNIILKMQTTLGVDFKKNSLSQALDALKPKLTDATYLSKVFGMENIAAAQFLIKNSDAVSEMTQQVTATNVAQEQAAIRTDTVRQMMARCQAKIDDLKIGFFELTGSFGGYATIVAQQAVTISQLVPLFGLMWKGLTLLTSVQKLFNLSLWTCPLTWIVAGIAALIAIIAVCMTKVQGWGKQWDSVVSFMKNCGCLFIETIKFEFSTMVDGIMIGLDYIRIGWYKFKEACGLGDSSENQKMIEQISADVEKRKQSIVDGAKKIQDLAAATSKSLTWELGWKQGKTAKEQNPAAGLVMPGAGIVNSGSTDDLSMNLGGVSSGKNGSSKILDLNNVVQNLKGSTAYAAIASRMSAVRLPIAAAAASLAMPMAVAATSLPQSPSTSAEYAVAGSRGGVRMDKFCDKIEIHIANADGKGYDQVEKEITNVLKKMLEDYEA